MPLFDFLIFVPKNPILPYKHKSPVIIAGHRGVKILLLQEIVLHESYTKNGMLNRAHYLKACRLNGKGCAAVLSANGVLKNVNSIT